MYPKPALKPHGGNRYAANSHPAPFVPWLYNMPIVALPYVSPVVMPIDIRLLSPWSPTTEYLQLDSSLMRRSTAPALRWNAKRDPTSVNLNCPSEYLARPATHPRVSRLSIRIAHPSYPWRIDVLPYSGTHYVTIGDILLSVHRSLFTLVTEHEWCSSNVPQHVRGRIASACRKRIGAVDTKPKKPKDGLRRVDYLMDKYMWDGMTISDTGYTDAYGQRDGVVFELIMNLP